jgi:hypothetical protein
MGIESEVPSAEGLSVDEAGVLDKVGVRFGSEFFLAFSPPESVIFSQTIWDLYGHMVTLTQLFLKIHIT